MIYWCCKIGHSKEETRMRKQEKNKAKQEHAQTKQERINRVNKYL